MTDEQHQWIWTEQGVDAKRIRRPADKWLLKLPSEHEDLWSAFDRPGRCSAQGSFRVAD